jgi:putative endonuclease
MAKHNDLGAWGEEYAAKYLQDRGYVILDRNWRVYRGKVDLDIVCRTPDQRVVAFVEVKTRDHQEVTDPIDAVDIRKIRHLGYAADAYVKMHNISEELRFDIFSIIGSEHSKDIQIDYIEDAFNPLLV